MPASSALTTGAVLLGALAITAAVLPSETARCSMIPFSDGRRAGEALLLGSARPDTVEAGPGEVKPPEGMRDGWGPDEPMRGQVVEIAQYAGADSLELARAFERRGSNRVVIVPWNYGATCQPLQWKQSALWVQPEQPGVFTVRLRPESHWADGMPTFDAFAAAFEPYPHGAFFRSGSLGTDSLRTTDALTPAEYFELLRAIPPLEDLSADPDAGWAAITEWRTQHPHIAGRFPAPRIIQWTGISVVYMKRRHVLRTLEPAIAGTWHFTVRVDDGPERTFYARTRRSPTTDWGTLIRSDAPPDPDDVPDRVAAYNMIASGALSVDSLPGGCGRDERTMAREGYIGAIEQSGYGGEQPTDWRGMIDVRLLERQFPDDDALPRFERRMRGHVAANRGDRYAPARFTVDDEGIMRVEQTIELTSGSRLVVRGERVSAEVIACDG